MLPPTTIFNIARDFNSRDFEGVETGKVTKLLIGLVEGVIVLVISAAMVS